MRAFNRSSSPIPRYADSICCGNGSISRRDDICRTATTATTAVRRVFFFACNHRDGSQQENKSKYLFHIILYFVYNFVILSIVY